VRGEFVPPRRRDCEFALLDRKFSAEFTYSKPRRTTALQKTARKLIILDGVFQFITGRSRAFNDSARFAEGAFCAKALTGQT
jgi:hypothetical protein